jgi:hypothetical protein
MRRFMGPALREVPDMLSDGKEDMLEVRKQLLEVCIDVYCVYYGKVRSSRMTMHLGTRARSRSGLSFGPAELLEGQHGANRIP